MEKKSTRIDIKLAANPEKSKPEYSRSRLKFLRRQTTEAHRLHFGCYSSGYTTVLDFLLLLKHFENPHNTN